MTNQNHSRYWVVLFISILLIPLLEGFGTIRIPLRSILTFTDRPSYWSFVVSIFALHWLSVIFIFKLIPQPFEFMSLKKAFFIRHKYILIASLVVIAIISYLAPSYLYGDALPDNSKVLGWIGPVSGIDRLAFVLLAITAGICEEVIFRGFGISALEKLTKNKWVALIISSFSFMAIHGIAFLPLAMLAQYFVIGLVFGWFYQKYRRLEYLIIVHATIDLLIPIAVP